MKDYIEWFHRGRTKRFYFDYPDVEPVLAKIRSWIRPESEDTVLLEQIKKALTGPATTIVEVHKDEQG